MSRLRVGSRIKNISLKKYIFYEKKKYLKDKKYFSVCCWKKEVQKYRDEKKKPEKKKLNIMVEKCSGWMMKKI